MRNSSIFQIKILIFLFSISISCSAQANKISVKSERPNIIFILADDMGYGDLSIQNKESKIPTPNLDRLAQEGMRFTDAHSPSAVCTPTRYSIMTGRYSWRSRLKKGVLWEWGKPLIEKNRLTIASMMRNAGYATALIGKWHLGWDWPTNNNETLKEGDTGESVDFTKAIEGGPLSVGFDYYFGDDVPNFPPYTFIENKHVVDIPLMLKPETMYGKKGVMAKGWDLSLVMPAIIDKSTYYIESRAGKDDSKPFFLFISLTAPHTPITPLKKFMGKSGAGAYGDFVYQVDHGVGDIISALDRTGLTDNTLIIFTSDNGSPGRDGENMSGELSSVLAYGHNPSSPWRGIKGDAWEGGHRVPFIAKWPSKIAKASVNNETFTLTDLMATFSDIINFRLPDTAAEDSLSLLPLFMSNELQTPLHESVVFQSYTGLLAIRKGKWKLIRGDGGGGISGKEESPWFWEPKWQLYDLETDPHEENNVYTENQDIARVLSVFLDGLIRSGRSTSHRELGDSHALRNH